MPSDKMFDRYEANDAPTPVPLKQLGSVGDMTETFGILKVDVFWQVTVDKTRSRGARLRQTLYTFSERDLFCNRMLWT